MLRYLFIIFLFFAFACKNDLSKIPQLEDYSKKPELTVEDFISNYKTDSKIQLEVKAKQMEKFTEKNYVSFPYGVTMIFFNAQLDTLTMLTCKYAENFLTDKLWRFADSVVVDSHDGGILKTQELYFDQGNEKIYSLKLIELTDTAGNFIRGKGGFEANFSFTVYEFKNVDGIIKVPEDEMKQF